MQNFMRGSGTTLFLAVLTLCSCASQVDERVDLAEPELVPPQEPSVLAESGTDLPKLEIVESASGSNDGILRWQVRISHFPLRRDWQEFRVLVNGNKVLSFSETRSDVFEVAISTQEFKRGNNIVLFYLNYDWDEAVKIEGAFTVDVFNWDGQNLKRPREIPPTLHLLNPKGRYHGTSSERILLDVIVGGVQIEESGAQVAYRLNRGKAMVLDQAKGYFFEGLKSGVYRLDVFVIDRLGKPMRGLEAKSQFSVVR